VKVGWWQCLAGISGDMALGALVDAGVALPELQSAVDAVCSERVVLTVSHVTRHGIGATKIDVLAPETTVVRTWANIRELLQQAELPERVRALALDAFDRLARAESRVHRVEPERVHFHEVGAHDALADIVASSAGVASLGIERMHCSPVALGIGMVRAEHGLVPVPAPAVLSVLREVRAPVYGGDAPYELTTPTGAALLAATVTEWGSLPPIRVEKVGVGAGSRDIAELPNVVRLVVGVASDLAASRSRAVVMEANIDDLDPRLWPTVLSRLLSAGASDAWLTPILMKKGRPAHTVAVLAPAESADEVRRVLFTETSTIGLREHPVEKRALDREVVTVDVAGCPVRVKIATLGGVVVNATPEYDDVAAAANELGRPVKAVLAAAVAATHRAHPWT
jgi:uncharacterized protein (TIGR00299 family) protein